MGKILHTLALFIEQMPRIPGNKKEKITFTCDALNLRSINAAISRDEFSSVSEAINKSISFYFENRDKPSGREWLISEEGEIYLKDLIRKVKGKT